MKALLATFWVPGFVRACTDDLVDAIFSTDYRDGLVVHAII